MKPAGQKVRAGVGAGAEEIMADRISSQSSAVELGNTVMSCTHSLPVSQVACSLDAAFAALSLLLCIEFTQFVVALSTGAFVHASFAGLEDFIAHFPQALSMDCTLGVKRACNNARPMLFLQPLLKGEIIKAVAAVVGVVEEGVLGVVVGGQLIQRGL